MCGGGGGEQPGLCSDALSDSGVEKAPLEMGKDLQSRKSQVGKAQAGHLCSGIRDTGENAKAALQSS